MRAGAAFRALAHLVPYSPPFRGSGAHSRGVAGPAHTGGNVIGVRAESLPQRRRLLSYPLKGDQSDEVECRGGVSYQTTFQLEQVPTDVFWTFQQELTADGQKKGMLYTFNSSGRMAMGALSYIHVETRARSMLIQAFHTFPDDHAIVKSQSLFKLP